MLFRVSISWNSTSWSFPLLFRSFVKLNKVFGNQIRKNSKFLWPHNSLVVWKVLFLRKELILEVFIFSSWIRSFTCACCMNMFLIDFPAVEDDDSSATEALLMPDENNVSSTINFSKKKFKKLWKINYFCVQSWKKKLCFS